MKGINLDELLQSGQARLSGNKLTITSQGSDRLRLFLDDPFETIDTSLIETIEYTGPYLSLVGRAENNRLMKVIMTDRNAQLYLKNMNPDCEVAAAKSVNFRLIHLNSPSANGSSSVSDIRVGE